LSDPLLIDLSAAVDLYCERLGPGLAAEPLNAFSNIAFLGAAAWLLLRPGAAQRPVYARLLAVEILLIGLASLSFHLFATVGTEILDVAFIALFIYTYIACFFRHFVGWSWGAALLPVAAYLLISIWVARSFPPTLLNGSIAYLPPHFVLLLMAIWLLSTRRRCGIKLASAAGIFAVSLFLRTMDHAWCVDLPIGTHWLWHCLNAVTLVLITLSLDEPGCRAVLAGARK
jgi:hypothetical protein